jgi:hypothetical protein
MAERQPSYLEDDSPAITGNQYVLNPDNTLFTIPATQLTSKSLKNVPKSPRSKRLLKVLAQKALEESEELAIEKKRNVDMKVKIRQIETARIDFAETLRHPKSESEQRIVFQQPYLGASISESARIYLSSSGNGNANKNGAVSTKATRNLESKVEAYRSNVRSGAIRLETPGSPRPSKRRPIPNKGKEKGKQKVDTKEEHTDVDGEQTSESDKTELPRLRMLLAAAVSSKYMEKLQKAFVLRRILYPYEDDEHGLELLVRLQKWVRHKRLQKTFWTLLRRRRIVVKALIRHALRFQVRYKHKCATMVLDFIRTCFEQAGFRMTMKLFLFRVVRVQRTIRTFMECNRARRDILARKLEIMNTTTETWKEDENEKRSETAFYVYQYEPDLLYQIVRKYRAPYLVARDVYMRSLRAGDLTPAFQEQSFDGIRNFLKSKAASDEPPQYAGGTIKCPTFSMLNNYRLRKDLDILLHNNEKKAMKHARKLAKEADERRQQAEFEEAARRGEGHLYQLAQMRKREAKEVKQATPSQRFEEALNILKGYDKVKKKLVRDQTTQELIMEKEDKEEIAKLFHLQMEASTKLK